ncbi:MAG TPA: hypothetical protein VEC16_01015 [Alphaproteobacteria bacterium]|nr:hypothetical protein [Alphaproteobacteria bacterium]
MEIDISKINSLELIDEDTHYLRKRIRITVILKDKGRTLEIVVLPSNNFQKR